MWNLTRGTRLRVVSIRHGDGTSRQYFARHGGISRVEHGSTDDHIRQTDLHRAGQPVALWICALGERLCKERKVRRQKLESDRSSLRRRRCENVIDVQVERARIRQDDRRGQIGRAHV